MFFKKKKTIINQNLNKEYIPEHVAFIMDGNGRWAKRRKMPVYVGHSKGVERVEDIIEAGVELGIKYMSFYTFSTENWKRSEEEIDHLFKLLNKFYENKFPKLNEQNIRIKFIGSKDKITADLIEIFEKMEKISENNDLMTVNIAFNYGGRLEIVESANKLIEQGHTKIDEQMLNDALYTSGQPDVDVMIRTSGEERISNFLIWQLSYAEFVFTDVHWPDFDKDELEKCLIQFQSRNRRFGGR